MHNLKLCILGTGTSQGIPVLGCGCEVCTSDNTANIRTRSSAYIEHPNANFLIDIGPDFRQQMLANNLEKLDFILITHEHNDHVAGLDEVRSLNYRWKKDIPILSLSRVIESLKKRFDYIFVENPHPGLPKIELIEIGKEEFEFMGVKIIPIQVLHGKLPILGFRIEDLVYITDAKYIPEEEFKKIKGCKVLVLNALRKEAHSTHLSLSDALDIINKISPEKAYLTHLSHLLGKPELISAELPQNVYLSYDGLKLEI